jgi:hypothetical protein
MKSIRLREGKERSLQRRHPWVFDGAIAKGSGDAGETVKVESHDGRFLAWAAVSPSSKIRARVWSFDEAQRIDAAFFSARIAAALKARTLFDIQSDGMRLVHGESDGLPGLIVDRYGDTLVAQFTSAGVERWNRVLDKAGIPVKLKVPHKAFHRNIGALSGIKVSPDGRVLSEAEWQARVNEWLPNGDDRAYVASLMGRVVEPGKFANWIAPPVMGINRQPVDFDYVRFN